MKETDKAYLAGLIDGEGTVSIVRLRGRKVGFQHYIACVELSNTNWSMIQWVMERLGGSVVVDARKKVIGQKQIYRLGLRNRLAEKVLREVFPYLVLKSAQAELVLELRERINSLNRKRLSEAERSYRAHLFDECAKLNRRGYRDAERLSERTPEKGMRQSELAGNELREGAPKSLPADESRS